MTIAGDSSVNGRRGTAWLFLWLSDDLVNKTTLYLYIVVKFTGTLMELLICNIHGINNACALVYLKLFHTETGDFFSIVVVNLFTELQ